MPVPFTPALIPPWPKLTLIIAGVKRADKVPKFGHAQIQEVLLIVCFEFLGFQGKFRMENGQILNLCEGLSDFSHLSGTCVDFLHQIPIKVSLTHSGT